MSTDLVGSLEALLEEAIATARNEEVAERLREARVRLLGPLRLAIAGMVNAGKSTLLNALLGEELAPTDAGECTKIVTWYELGHAPQVTLHRRDGGEPVQPHWDRQGGALEVELGTLAADEVERMTVAWPSSRLRRLTVLDTPGIASISADISERTHRVLSAEGGRVPVADAVLYLMRHAHASDVRFLESFHDDDLAHGTPLNSIGVLSRADEIGSCRLDAMRVAQRVASRYEEDPRLHRLCPVVVPVNGLLAFTAVTLREAEFALLVRLVAAPEAEVDALLLTADRFLRRERPDVLTELERQHLMGRLGLFGLRLCVELIRRGIAVTAAALAAELSEISGLNRLAGVLDQQFYARTRVLKARSTIAVLSDVLRSGGCHDSADLEAAVERLATGTHEFEEVRLLAALHAGELDLRPESSRKLERLLGGRGHDTATRLGLPADATAEEIRSTALAALDEWRRMAEHPLSSRPVQVAARVAARTLEGLLSNGA